MGYFYIFGCIFFTVYGQLILQWRPSAVSGEFAEKALFLAQTFLDPVILFGFAAAFVAILFLNALFFHEPTAPGKFSNRFRLQPVLA